MHQDHVRKVWMPLDGSRDQSKSQLGVENTMFPSYTEAISLTLCDLTQHDCPVQKQKQSLHP